LTSFAVLTDFILDAKSSLNMSINVSRISGQSSKRGNVEITGSPYGLTTSPSLLKSTLER